MPGLNQLNGELVKLLEIIRGVIFPSSQVESEPAHVFLDRIDVLDIFLARIGIVESQIALAAELGGQAEIETDRFGVTDVKITVGLRRKTRMDPALIFALLEILDDDVANKMRRRRLGRPAVLLCCLRLLSFPRPILLYHRWIIA